MKIKNWYVSKFPSDELGKEINPDCTFEILSKDIENVYDNICVGDSIIRERVFEKLAEIMNVDYSVVYNSWLGEY